MSKGAVIHIQDIQDIQDNLRSYVEFYIESEIVEKIYAYLETDPRIWSHFEWRYGLEWSSVESNTISLSKKDRKKVWKNHVKGRFNSRKDSPSIAYGMIICKDFGGNQRAYDILEDYINKIRKNIRI